MLILTNILSHEYFRKIFRVKILNCGSKLESVSEIDAMTLNMFLGIAHYSRANQNQHNKMYYTDNCSSTPYTFTCWLWCVPGPVSLAGNVSRTLQKVAVKAGERDVMGVVVHTPVLGSLLRYTWVATYRSWAV